MLATLWRCIKKRSGLSQTSFVIESLFAVRVAVTGLTVFFAMGIGRMAGHTCSYYCSRLVLRHEGAISLGVEEFNGKPSYIRG